MSQELSADLKLFCPRKDCPYWHKLENKITKDGVYVTVKDLHPRQMFHCYGGKHRFSETNYSGLFGKQGSFREYEQAVKLSCYGLGVDAIADVLQVDARTVATWLQCVSKKANLFHDKMCLYLTASLLFIEVTH